MSDKCVRRLRKKIVFLFRKKIVPLFHCVFGCWIGWVFVFGLVLRSLALIKKILVQKDVHESHTLEEPFYWTQIHRMKRNVHHNKIHKLSQNISSNQSGYLSVFLWNIAMLWVNHLESSFISLSVDCCVTQSQLWKMSHSVKIFYGLRDGNPGHVDFDVFLFPSMVNCPENE